MIPKELWKLEPGGYLSTELGMIRITVGAVGTRFQVEVTLRVQRNGQSGKVLASAIADDARLAMGIGKSLATEAARSDRIGDPSELGGDRRSPHFYLDQSATSSRDRASC